MTSLVKLRHNVWILSVENNDHIAPSQVIEDLKRHQHQDIVTTIKVVVSKRETTPS